MTLRLERVSPAVRAKAAPFLEELARLAGPGCTPCTWSAAP